MWFLTLSFSLCTGGRSGICWPNFASLHNNAPVKAHHLNMNYNAIKGLMTVKSEFRLWGLGPEWLLKTLRCYDSVNIEVFTMISLFLLYLSRHDICCLPKCLLQRDGLHVHNQPDQWGPAAPCACFRHNNGWQRRGGPSLRPQAWCEVNHCTPTDTKMAKSVASFLQWEKNETLWP